jgi:hypothetical protein
MGVKEDVAAIREPIVAATTQGRDVVVIVHSYGGIVGPSGIKGLTPPKGGRDQASSGYVVGLVLIATGFAATGISFLDGVGGKPPPSWMLDPSGFAKLVVDPIELFYQDMPREGATSLIGELVPQSSKALTEGGEYVYSGWKDIPAWYLVTNMDKAFPDPPGAIQNFFAQTAKDGGADVTVREIDTSHSPTLSKPEETTEFILDAVKAFA